MTPDTALFFNGVYEGVFLAILAADVEEAFLQPYKGQPIGMLRDSPPTRSRPTRFYASTTKALSQVSYSAEIVRWEDKRELSEARRQVVLRFLRKHQPKEVDLFLGIGIPGKNPVNLLTVRRLEKLRQPFSTGLLRKKSDGLPLRLRTQAGGWSPVHDQGAVNRLIPVVTDDALQEELSVGVKKSHALSQERLLARLARASTKPEKVQVVSVGFRRNPNVIVAVLRRAQGNCEHCLRPAPFLRRSDGSPFLEVHHTVPLAEGGEDTVSNSVALCPNCHRKAHYGPES